MSIERNRLRWNGWGWLEAPDILGDKADSLWAWMGKAVGLDPLPDTPAMPLENVTLPPMRLGEDVLAGLEVVVGPDRLKVDDFERAFHARGQSYHDLLWLRAGNIDVAPDAVVYAVSAAECVELVRFAVERNIALVPYGGGSSVVGGVSAVCGDGQAGVITLDTTLMDKVVEIDKESLTARVQAGIYGPQLEDALQAEGYTLGHYPQSFEFSTLGGWIAPRSAGHQSNMYGTAEEWLVSAQVATPEGLWNTEGFPGGFPGSAAGPQMRDVVAGSEGLLGVITEAVVRIHRAPEVKDYRGFVFPDFGEAVAALREIMQRGVPNAMVRLSDPPETFFLNAVDSGGAGAGETSQFSLMLVGFEGNAEDVEHSRELVKAIAKGHGGIHMGEGLGASWYKGRFETPYLRDPMMDRGLGVDTLETCTVWSNVIHLHDTVCAAIADAMAAHPGGPGTRGIVMSHLSHSYHAGSSLYFTFAFPRDLEGEVEQWWAIKRAASDAIVANGGTISHHHGVGTDHLEWNAREKGPTGVGLLKAVKDRLDPTGVLNPGKLIV